MTFLLSLLLFLVAPHTEVVSVKQANKALDVSVLIRAKQYEQDLATLTIKRGMAGCSGTYVSSTTVLTAAHCFSNPTTDVWVRGTDHGSYRAQLIKLDPEHDLALLSVKGPRHVFAKVVTKVHIGEQVTNVGSPLMFEFLVSEGIVAATGFRHKPFTGSYLVTTAMINPGSSGGGAFNSKGQLIGVNTMVVGLFGGWAGISMAVDGATVQEFLGGLK